MKKILVLTSTFPKSHDDSVPMFVLDQLQSIEDKYKNIKFYVLVPHYYDDKLISKKLEIEQFRFHYFWPFKFEKLVGRGILPSLNKNSFNYFLIPFFILSQFFVTIYYVIKLKPDLIYAHWFFPQAVTSLLIKKLFKIPYVFTTHAFDAEIMKKIPLLGKFLARKVISNSNSYTADSADAEKSIHSYFVSNNINLKKSLVLPMPIKFRTDLKISKLVSYAVDKMNKSHTNLLFVGRFAEKKGVEKLLYIFKNVLNDFPKANLYLAGSGPLLSEYKELVSNLGIHNSVEFLGYVNSTEKKILYDSSDLVIVPSIKLKLGDKEGLPVVVLESLSSNTLTMASYQSNAGEIIIDSLNGYLFDPQEATESAEKIVKILTQSNKSKLKIIENANKLSKQYLSENSAEKFYTHLFDMQSF